MRIYSLAVCLACMLMLLLSASAQGAIVTLSDKHVSIDVPSGWTSMRNHSIGGTNYDLYMESPVSGGYKADGTLLTAPWLGSITYDTVYAAMAQSIHEAEIAFGSANFEVIASVNMTIGGELANQAILRVNVSGTIVMERFVIVVSSSWMREYAFAFAVVDSQWESYNGAFLDSINSITFAQKQGGIGELPIALIAGVVLIAIVIVAVVALLMFRKKKQPTSILQQPAQSPIQPHDP